MTRSRTPQAGTGTSSTSPRTWPARRGRSGTSGSASTNWSPATRTPPEGPVFYLGLRLGDSDLGLVSDASVDGAPAGRIILSIEVPDVDARLDDVRRLGGAVTGGPADMPWGQRVAHTTDPDGNVVNLTTTSTA